MRSVVRSSLWFAFILRSPAERTRGHARAAGRGGRAGAGSSLRRSRGNLSGRQAPPGNEGLRLLRPGRRPRHPAVRRRDPRGAEAFRAQAGPDPREGVRRGARALRDHRGNERKSDLRGRQARSARSPTAGRSPRTRSAASPRSRACSTSAMRPPAPPVPIGGPAVAAAPVRSRLSRSAGSPARSTRCSRRFRHSEGAGSMATLPLPVSFAGGAGGSPGWFFGRLAEAAGWVAAPAGSSGQSGQSHEPGAATPVQPGSRRLHRSPLGRHGCSPRPARSRGSTATRSSPSAIRSSRWDPSRCRWRRRTS